MESLTKATHNLSLGTFKADASSTASQVQCRLFTVPGELRNKVYELAFHEDSAIVVDYSGKCQTPPLLVSCKRIRHEARSIYYNINTLTLRMNWYSMNGPRVWAKAASKVLLKHVKRLTIAFNTYDYLNPQMEQFRVMMEGRPGDLPGLSLLTQNTVGGVYNRTR